jgi:hypothetical protein
MKVVIFLIIALGTCCARTVKERNDPNPDNNKVFEEQHHKPETNDVTPEQEFGSKGDYLLKEGMPGLTRFVKESKIVLCANMKDVPDNVKPSLIQHVTNATLKWIEPLRALSKEKLASKVEIGFWSSTNGLYPNSDPIPDNCHAGMVIIKDRWPAVQTTVDKPVIFLNTGISVKDYRTILHEFGHAFGLADTYDLSHIGSCLPGQPFSVMCTSEQYDDLQAYDIGAIREVYKKTFPN